MCARLLACPLCSQPSFVTLDALRTGLVSASTRPLMCPVCNEVVFGIDKLTIHLFGHTIGSNNHILEIPKLYTVSQNSNIEVTVHAPQSTRLQKWNLPITENVGLNRDNAESTNITNLEKTINLVNSQDYLHIHERQDKVCHSEIPKNDILNSVQKTSATVPEKCEGFQGSLNTERLKSTPLYSSNDNVYKNLNIVDTKESNGSEFLPTWAENLSHICDNYSSTSKLCTNATHCDEVLKVISESSRNQENVSKEAFVANTIWKENVLTDILPEHCISRNANNETTESCSLENKELNSTKVSEASINFLKDDNQNEVSMQALLEKEITKKSATKERAECCDICGFYFLDPNILTLHKQLVHKINEKEQKLQKSETYEEMKSYPCQLCSKIFKMRGSLMIHMRVAHSGYNLGSLPKKNDIVLALNNNDYNCPTCGKSFKKEQHVVQHLKTHNGKQWKCDVCYKMFTTKYFLKKHKRLHSGEMPYKCNICDKTFTFQQSYHKHRLYHKADKPHTCRTCGRSFKELSTLHNHERIHTGEKPFACETCGKCFRQRVSYLVHRRIHTGLMPYKCTLCGKSFRYKVSQRTHKCSMQLTQNDSLQMNDQTILQTGSRTDKYYEVTNLQESNFSEQNGTDLCIINSEENKYILIINTQGQHVLKKESDIKSKVSVNKNETDNVKVNNGDRQCEKVWNSDISYDSKQYSQMATDQTRDDNLCLRSDHDFFSMVMSPVHSESISQLTKIEHLRLSSPIDEEILKETCNSNFKIITNEFHLNVNNAHVEENFSGGINVTTPLQTINEESFKQLLYNTEKKE